MQRLIQTVALATGIVTASSIPSLAAQFTYSSLPVPTPETRADDITAANTAENSFLATLGSSGTETFDEMTGNQIGATASQALTFGSSGITGVATYSGVFGIFFLAYTPNNALVEQPAAAGQPPYQNDITLSTPVTAFGAYFIQAGDGDADTITLQLDNTITGTSKDVVVGTAGPGAIFNTLFYFGVTDTDPFNRVTLLLSNGNDGVLLDNVTVGNVAAPEPASLLLLALAAPCLWRMARRARVRQ